MQLFELHRYNRSTHNWECPEEIFLAGRVSPSTRRETLGFRCAEIQTSVKLTSISTHWIAAPSLRHRNTSVTQLLTARGSPCRFISPQVERPLKVLTSHPAQRRYLRCHCACASSLNDSSVETVFRRVRSWRTIATFDSLRLFTLPG